MPLLALTLATWARSAPAQAPLDSTDFIVGTLRERLDSAAVRRTLGAPDSIHLSRSPFDVGGKVVSWQYGGLLVQFHSSDHVRGITLSDSKVSTRRGLRVGDSLPRLQTLYGAPTATYGDVWIYEEASRRRHIMHVVVRVGRIVSIYLGWVVD